MAHTIIKENGFKYVDEGKGKILLLLHGLFGALSNWETVISYFSKNYRVIIPILPIYELPVKDTGLEGLVTFIEDFVNEVSLHDLTLLGNSLGGHLALIYTLNNPEKVKRLLLTGSSGLFENSMGGSYPKRGSYEYIKDRVEYTFYLPEIATKELVDEVYEIITSIPKCLRVIAIARSAQRHNMAKQIIKINVPALLVWGLNDTITPPFVAHEFNRLLKNSKLHFLDKCCHVPMMEHPDKFNVILNKFLEEN
ncbi:MAG: alpha/beta hydrolase [Cytophagales bacterium]|nr:alpha/beta hydrolase [Cytophagales bacterium]